MSPKSVSVSKKGLISMPCSYPRLKAGIPSSNFFLISNIIMMNLFTSFAFNVDEGHMMVCTRVSVGISFIPGCIVSYSAKNQFLFRVKVPQLLKEWYLGGTYGL